MLKSSQLDQEGNDLKPQNIHTVPHIYPTILMGCLNIQPDLEQKDYMK